MLNFTAGLAGMKSALATAQVKRVITARRLVEVACLQDVVAGLDAEIVYLEDVRKNLDAGQQADRSAGQARAAPLVRQAGPGRHGGDPVHLRHRRPAQRRGAQPSEYPGQCRPGARPYRSLRQRCAVQSPARLSLFRTDGGHAAAPDRGGEGGLPSHPASAARDRAPHPSFTAPPYFCPPTPSSPNMPAPASRRSRQSAPGGVRSRAAAR